MLPPMTGSDGRPLPVMRKTFTVPGEVIDANGHVNNVHYVQWMQDLAVEHWNAVGGMEVNAAAGCTWVAHSHHIVYLRPAFAGDTLEALTWVTSIGRVRSTRRYAFRRLEDGQLLARGETEWVFVRIKTGRPGAIPESVHARLPVSGDPF